MYTVQGTQFISNRHMEKTKHLIQKQFNTRTKPSHCNHIFFNCIGYSTIRRLNKIEAGNATDTRTRWHWLECLWRQVAGNATSTRTPWHWLECLMEAGGWQCHQYQNALALARVFDGGRWPAMPPVPGRPDTGSSA